MSQKQQCPECHLMRMTKLQLIQRWWCTFCNHEVDVDSTVNEWAKHGYSGGTNGRP